MTSEERETIQRLVQIVMILLDDLGEKQVQIVLFEAADKADLLGQELFHDPRFPL